MHIRRGRRADLPELIKLEAACFEKERRDSSRIITRSLESPHQEIWLMTDGPAVVGYMALRFRSHTCRVHSIAVIQSLQGRGMGRKFLAQARNRALARGCSRINLEADSRNELLLGWYLSNGYKRVRRLPDYYAPNWDAYRFTQNLSS